MSILSMFILTTALSQAADPSSQERDALMALSKAIYIKTDLDKKVKVWENRYVPKKYKEYSSWAVVIVKIASEKKVSYEWTF